jgi:hypothetical protein
MAKYFVMTISSQWFIICIILLGLEIHPSKYVQIAENQQSKKKPFEFLFLCAKDVISVL